MLLRTHLIVSLAVIFLTALLFLAHFAHAESVLWNTTFGPQKSYFRDLRYPDGSRPALAGHGGWVQFSTTQDQITYNIKVTDVDTGTVLAPGVSVPLTDRVKFEFVPHVFSDISFFTTGAAQDSPYGYWIAGAAPPPIACNSSEQVGGASDGVGPQLIYVAHSVNPPAQTLSTPSGMTCDTPDANGSQICTFNSAGRYTPTFHWAATNGNFYLRMTSPRFASGCIGSSSSYYNLAVPEQQYDFPLVVGTVVGAPPSSPQLIAAASGAGAGAAACTVGTPYSINMSATDPDNNSLRYLVDWNADGTVDQLVPPTGYVSSGTQETASRTFATAGSKTVQVKSQDDNGNASGWASLTFDCAASNDSTGGAGLGGGLGNGDNGSGSGLPIPDLSLRVVPSLVAKGTTTHVNWSATNVLSCSVTGQNGDTWIGLQSIIGGETSGPITQTTQYTLSCLGLDNTPLSQTATVTVLPVFQEQ